MAVMAVAMRIVLVRCMVCGYMRYRGIIIYVAESGRRGEFEADPLLEKTRKNQFSVLPDSDDRS